MPMQWLCAGLLVVRCELQGHHTVEVLVECFELGYATGDPRSDFCLQCVPQARPCHVVYYHIMQYMVEAGSPPICFQAVGIHSHRVVW